MKALKITLITLALLAIAILTIFWYSGAFAKIDVQQTQSEEYIIVGKLFTGPYYKVNNPMEQVDSLLRSIGIQSTRGFGIYYDNPESTPNDQCRSFVGNILELNNLSKIIQIQALGLTIDTIQSHQSVVLSLPTKTKLSYMIAPQRAYPALVKYINTHNLKPTLAVEIYDVPKQTTLFIMQVKQQ